MSFMKQIYGRVVRPAFETLGFDIRRHGIRTDPSIRICRVLSTRKIDLVLDIGANTGQFGQALFDNGFGGRVVSFDPLPDAHARLVERAGRSGRDWMVAPRAALDDKVGVARFIVATNSASSSLLDQSSRLAEVAPAAASVGEIEVPTATLDGAVSGFLGENDRVAIKIDTQGAELRVLQGGTATVRRADMILIEMSIAQLYEGQPSYHELDQYLRACGFSLIDIDPTVRDPNSGLLAEFDAIYVR